MFAIADGEFEHGGPRSGYTDPVIILKIFRPGENSCGTKGCYKAMYLHAAADCCNLVPGQMVEKGAFLGTHFFDARHELALKRIFLLPRAHALRAPLQTPNVLNPLLPLNRLRLQWCVEHIRVSACAF